MTFRLRLHYFLAIFSIPLAAAMPAGADGSMRTAALKRRGEQVALMLDRARQRGEKPPDITEVIDHLLAPLYLRTLFGMRVDRAVADRLVERLLK